MDKAFFAILFFWSFALSGQVNLVPNPSFEEYSSCPTAPGNVGYDQLEKALYWYKPNLATTDYYNACQTDLTTGVNAPSNWMGHQYAFQGDAYVGLVIYEATAKSASEYVQCRLSAPLEPCKTYSVRFWTSLGDYCPKATNTLGARLDVTPIHQTTPNDFNGFIMLPHISVHDFITDTMNWVLITGTYLAQGGEEYLTIGRFIDTTQYAFNEVPNIDVPCNPCIDFGVPAQYYIDSVSIMANEDNFMDVIIPNIITANADGVNDVWHPGNGCGDLWECIIYGRWGNKIFSFSAEEPGWDGQNHQGINLPDGVYYYCIYNNEKKAKGGFIHLVR